MSRCRILVERTQRTSIFSPSLSIFLIILDVGQVQVDPQATGKEGADSRQQEARPRQ